MNIVDAVRKIPNAEFASQNTNLMDIRIAEQALDIHFPIEYTVMLMCTGALRCPFLNICGLDKNEENNVVEQTKKQRLLNGIPKEYFVLEHPTVDGIVLLQSTKGDVVEFDNGKITKKLAPSLKEYILQIFYSFSRQKSA